jgi:hypothetical protein
LLKAKYRQKEETKFNSPNAQKPSYRPRRSSRYVKAKSDADVIVVKV